MNLFEWIGPVSERVNKMSQHLGLTQEEEGEELHCDDKWGGPIGWTLVDCASEAGW